MELITLLLLGISASEVKDLEPVPANAKGLSVHEWGVFRVNEDVDFANAALRAEWDDLPGFVYGQIKGRVVPQHWGALEERLRPIIFFHAKEPAMVRVKIDFPGGMAGVWFPATERPAVYGFEKQPKIGGSLEWNLGVKQCPNGWLPKNTTPPEVSDKHWIHGIRQVKADEIYARYSPNNMDVEREKFIYYDGLFPQKRWMKVVVDGKQVSLMNQVKHAVFDVTVVDRRAERIRIGRHAKLDAGEKCVVQFNEIEASRFTSEAVDALAKQLVAAGLNDDEAKSLIDNWKVRMFETPGLHLFYRLPQSEYDVLMPLTITPKPESVVRVGLIFQGHLEPDFAERILELVKLLDAPKFADRDAATKKLLAIGPAALVQIQRFRDRKDLSIEVKERIDSLVKKWSSKEAFDR